MASSSRLRAVLEVGRAHQEATGVARDDGPVYRTWERESERALERQRSSDDGPVYRTWERESGRALERERDRDRDRGVLSQFEQMRIRNGECITLEVPEFRRWDAVQVVPPGRYPMTKELVLAFATSDTPIKEYTLNVSNRNDPHFTIRDDPYN